MKAATLLLSLCLGAGVLTAQNAQQIADSLQVPALKAGDKTIPVPKVKGAKVSIFCTDYEQLVDKKGKIKSVISPTTVRVAYKVEKDGQTAISKDHAFTLPAKKASGGNPKPQTIPSILQWQGGKGQYQPGKDVKIYAPAAKPELQKLIAKDFKDVTGATVSFVTAAEGAGIIMEEGKPTKLNTEKYQLDITDKGVKVTAYSQQGLFYATRTMLQILRQTKGTLPCGKAVDFPRYKIRGFMLDVGRTPITLEDIRNVIDTMAWYKMNDLHIHLNDNYIFHEHYVKAGRDPFKESYSAFRLESNVKGKDGTPLTASDLFYTKKEFIELVQYAKLRGVDIVPEFDAPAHALSFTRVRPDLIYQGKMPHHPDRRCEALDAANPASAEFINSVFDEYLLKDSKLGRAVFGDCDVIHIGADEFFGDNEGYRKFADRVLSHIVKRGHTARIWGSLSKKPGKTPVTSKGVQMNLWNEKWMNPWEAINQGFDVINTNDADLYIVPFANYYRMDLNMGNVFNKWKPNVIGKATLPSGHPKLLGATYAIWNDESDLRHSGYGCYDMWDMITIPGSVLAQKTWGPEEVTGDLDSHKKLLADLGHAPGCNPLHQWKKMEPFTLEVGSLPQKIGKPDLGPNYRLDMEVELTQETPGKEQALLSGPSGVLLAADKDGNVAFRRADTMEFSFGYKLPVGKKVRMEIIGKPMETKLFIDGKEAGTLTLTKFRDPENGFNPRQKGLRSTFILPLKTLGASFKGKVYSFSITPSAPSASEEIISVGEAPTTVPD